MPTNPGRSYVSGALTYGMTEEEVVAVITAVYGLSRMKGTDAEDARPGRANWFRRSEKPAVQPSWRDRPGHSIERSNYHRA